MKQPITVARPTFGQAEERNVLQVLRSGRIAQGPMIERLEELSAQMAGTRYAVSLANGTFTLEALLAAVGIGKGDEVITTPFTFAATVNAAVRAGATVRMADIGWDYLINPGAVETLIGPATKAVIPVHLYGQAADMGEISRLAERAGLAVIEDAAQAHGAKVDGRAVGGWGHGSFSFYATKNISAGEGGVVTTNDETIARAVRTWRNQGMAGRYEYETVGTNGRMTELGAAVAVPQMERLDEINATRRRNAAALTEMLEADERVEGTLLPSVAANKEHVWNQYTVLVPTGVDRDKVIETMTAAGVIPGVYYPELLTEVKMYAETGQVRPDPTPVAREITRRCLSLPVHNGLDASELERVAAAYAAAVRKGRS